MAVRNYIVQECMSGSDSEHIQRDVYQMSFNDQFAVSDPISIIADDIYTSITDIIDSRYKVQHIRKILRNDAKKGLVGYDSEKASVVIHCNKDEAVYYYDIINTDSYKFRKIYRIQTIDDADVCYLVAEYIPIDEGRQSVKRCYSPYFKDLHAANDYLDQMSEHCDIENFRISVENVNDLNKSEWYARNISAFDKIIRYNLDPNDYRHIIDLDLLDDTIMANAYSNLPLSEQVEIDIDLYKRVYKFLSVDRAYMLDMDFENADDEDVIFITEAAIAAALTQAASYEEFDAIYKVLGPHSWRISSLTDEIYNRHPDKGYILVAADGEMKWYPECNFINSWDGARGNPYYGKFQNNICDTLLCFKEYHPELIVDIFPSDELMNEYESRYKEECAAERQAHEEMYFYVDDDGDEIIVGDWYYNGVESSDAVHGVGFMRVHKKHRFTEDECRTLLSGDEVVIDNFKTKSGIVTTIRGKLRSVSGTYDEDTLVEFIRTDLDYGIRKKLNNELGIVEPGVVSV